MSKHSDILIVGGGVIGLTTAWYLAALNAQVTLVERGETGRQASWAGAGILPPCQLDTARTPLDQLRAHSNQLFPLLSAELRDLTGVDNGYTVCGGIEVADPENPEVALPTEEWHGEGTPFESLDRAALVRLEPLLHPDITSGVWLPGMAQVRNPWHLRALRQGCVQRGVEVLTDWPVRHLRTSEGRVLAVEGDRGKLSAGRYLLTAGAWSEQLLHQIGWQPGIHPVRGQMLLYNTGRPGIHPLLLQGKRYLVPRTDGRLLAGSTEEYVGFEVANTPDGVRGLQELAQRLMPSLRDLTPEATWAGLRPGSPDGLPYLGAVPGWDNLYVSTGHFRSGLQLSAASGLALARRLLDLPDLLSLEPFRLDRPYSSR